jgi:hypothetical protein
MAFAKGHDNRAEPPITSIISAADIISSAVLKPFRIDDGVNKVHHAQHKYDARDIQHGSLLYSVAKSRQSGQ